MAKKYLFLLVSIAGLAALILALRWSAQDAGTPGKASATTSESRKHTAPSVPFDPSAFTPGEKVSAASIARLETRASELRQTRAQLAVKMKSLNARLAEPTAAANAASLREAKEALEKSLAKMEAEESALTEFLLNEQKGQSSNP